MNICARCNKKDDELFGGFIICNKTNKKIYCCFDCGVLCNFCNINPAIYKCFNLPENLNDVCKQCYHKAQSVRSH